MFASFVIHLPCSNRYALLYDDGDTEEGIAETLIQPAPELIVKVGESVNARFGGGLHYFAATIARITPRGMDLNYADGDFESDVQVKKTNEKKREGLAIDSWIIRG